MSDITKVLQTFCARAPYRPWMEKPFSRGDYTWATDGKAMIRVPRVEGIEEDPSASNVERAWKDGPATGWRMPLLRTLPACEMIVCDVCEGRGNKHDCPGCSCKCTECDGDGRLETIQWVAVGERHVNLIYARKIVALDFVEIVSPAHNDDMMHFRFDGGAGVVMLLRVTENPEVVATI